LMKTKMAVIMGGPSGRSEVCSGCGRTE